MDETKGNWKIDARKFSEHGVFHISNGDYIVATALGQTSSCECEALRHAELIVRAAATPSAQGAEISVPRVIDNDKGEITAQLDGKEIRGWSYSSDQERRSKMLCAREYVEGFCDGRQS